MIVRKISHLFVFVLLVATAVTAASAAVDARLLRYPDVSESHVAFVYADPTKHDVEARLIECIVIRYIFRIILLKVIALRLNELEGMISRTP